MNAPASDVILCPLCDVPHRVVAVACDGCGQALHVPLDLGQMRLDHAAQKRRLVLSAVVVIAMLALNVAFVEHAGGFVIATAPLGWLIWSAIRFRALSRRLSRAAARRHE